MLRPAGSGGDGNNTAAATTAGDAVCPPGRRLRQTARCEGSVVVERVKGLEGLNGFNAAKEMYEDLIAAGMPPDGGMGEWAA